MYRLRQLCFKREESYVGSENVAAAALRLLNVNPAASMSEIARGAGVSRSTLHRHFATREDLVTYLGHLSLESWRRALDDSGIDAAARDGDFAQCRAALDALCAELVRDADEYGFTLTEQSLQADDEIIAAGEVLQNRELDFYARAQKVDALRSDMPAAWFAHAMFGMLVGLREALRCGDIAASDAKRLLSETISAGIAA